MLYVHGFTDYFYQSPSPSSSSRRDITSTLSTCVKCGRSRRAGQTAHYVSDLSFYDVELSLAVDVIAAEVGIGAGEDDPKIIVAAHSTGALITRCGSTVCAASTRPATVRSAD